MGIQMKGSYLFVNPGEPCFLVSSNYTNYLEIGSPGSNDFYLIASVQDGQHLIDAALFDDKGKLLCRVVRNHLQDIEEGTWKIKVRPDGGFSVVNGDGETLMSVALDDNGICRIAGKFYDKSGTLIAAGDGNDFLILKGPAVLGKSGAMRGIVVGA